MKKIKTGYTPKSGGMSRPPYMPGLTAPLTPAGSKLKPKKISGIGQGGRAAGQGRMPAKKFRIQSRITSQ